SGEIRSEIRFARCIKNRFVFTEPQQTMNHEILTKIATWLSEFSDFVNFGVACGVRWRPATQAQRLIKKHGPGFLTRINTRTNTRTKPKTNTQTNARHVLISAQQLDFYKYLVRCMPRLVEATVRQLIAEKVFSDQLVTFFQLGVKAEVTETWLMDAMQQDPVAVELLLENGCIGDHNMPRIRDPVSRLVSRMLRWGLPMDSDALLIRVVNYTTRQYDMLEGRLLAPVGFEIDVRRQVQAQKIIRQIRDRLPYS
ncbi:hypothetical protein HK102_003141, partial [Quaeritorhiza haematococci]